MHDGARKKEKKDDTHASSTVLQVVEQHGPVDGGPAGLNWPFVTIWKPPGLIRRHTQLKGPDTFSDLIAIRPF